MWLLLWQCRVCVNFWTVSHRGDETIMCLCKVSLLCGLKVCERCKVTHENWTLSFQLSCKNLTLFCVFFPLHVSFLAVAWGSAGRKENNTTPTCCVIMTSRSFCIRGVNFIIYNGSRQRWLSWSQFKVEITAHWTVHYWEINLLIVCLNKLNINSDWWNTILYCFTLFVCLFVADPATFLATNSVLWTIFRVCIITSSILWVLKIWVSKLLV